MSEYLFIGGIKDVERIEVPDNKGYLEICMMDEPSIIAVTSNTPLDECRVNIKRETYKNIHFMVKVEVCIMLLYVKIWMLWRCC